MVEYDLDELVSSVIRIWEDVCRIRSVAETD
jgi:hypothetical protein